MSRALRDHGAKVMIVGRDADALARAKEDLSGDIETVAADLTTESGISRCVEATAARFGGIDILINNAGINIRHRPETYPREDWNQVLSVKWRFRFCDLNHDQG